MSSENKIKDPSIYLQVIEAMPFGIIIANSKGEFLLWNEKASYIMHVSNTAIEQQDWVKEFGVYNLDKTTMYKTEELPMSRAILGETVIKEKMYIRNNEMMSGIYIKVTSFPIIENGEIKAAVVLFDDITKEQELYESIINKISDLETYLKELTARASIKSQATYDIYKK